MAIAQSSSLSVNEQANVLLDANLAKIAEPYLSQIYRRVRRSGEPIHKALVALQDRQDQLAELEETISISDPAMQKVLSTFHNLMDDISSEVLPILQRLEDTGKEIGASLVLGSILLNSNSDIALQTLSLPAMQRMAQLLKVTGIHIPSWDELDAVYYTDTWAANREQWVSGYDVYLRESIQSKMQKETDVSLIAWLINFIFGIPFYAVENTVRTLQAVAYREGMLITEKTNSTYLAYKIRVAQLDTRTCLACIGLHGSVMAIGNPLVDHFRGRCSCYYVIAGIDNKPETMKVEIAPGKYEVVPFQSGDDFFAALPAERQEQQLAFQNSPGKLAAYRSGIPLRQFVVHSHDPIFGDMIHEGSLVGLFGDRAFQFYSSNRRS